MKKTSNDKNSEDREDKLGSAVKLLAKVVSDTNSQHEKAAKKSIKGAKEVAIITLIGIMITVMVSSYFNTQSERLKIQFVQVQDLQHEINVLVSKKDQVMTSLTNIRGIRSVMQRMCNDQTQKTFREYQIKNIHADYDLINSSYAGKGIFSDKINSHVVEFIRLIDIDRLNVCNKKAPVDAQLQLLERKIGNEITESINALKNQKKNLENALK